ncbi:hypothetical protein RvY_02936 [Ramazzottius varieornatus]|uniref:ZP domain-containing protein n=1 Tax=Ramazzottius varieornatus TaxID=947166 RepID=A0A1D1UPT5_RAMVA|nr:hypothetical protein RvY_02936 [Ramazzottius varieornatus]
MAKLSCIALALLLQVAFTFTADSSNRIKSLNVKCGDADMLVDIEFNQPFNGIIFSKGYFARNECVYVKANPSKYSYEFTISYSGCGTTAGGSGISTTGARRSDGFLRSESDVAANGTRARREVAAGTNGSTISGAQGRSLGGYGMPGMGSGPEPFGDPYASMGNQDLSAGPGPGMQMGAPGGMGGGMGEMGGMGAGGNPYANLMGSGPQYQSGPNSAYSNQMPIYGAGQAGGYHGGAMPQMPAPQMPVQQPNMQQPSGVWNGGAPQGGQQVFSNNNQNQQFSQSSVRQQGNNARVSGSAFASSIPGGGQVVNQDQHDDQSSEQDIIDSTSSLDKNQPFSEDRTGGSSRFFENIIIIQYDANIQEVWDVAKALRCEWHDNYHKTVAYKPFQVDSLEVVPATFAGDNVGVWMTVQQGKGPYAPEVNGIVRIGEYLTLAIGIQDKTKKFDMRVVNCFASDGNRPAIQLVDEYGCVTRPKIMSDIAKVTNYGDQASVVAYAYFQAFKFPDSVDVHLECSVEICKFGCAKQCYNKMLGLGDGRSSGAAVASVSSDVRLGSVLGSRGQQGRKVDVSSSSFSDDSSDSSDSASSFRSSSASASGKNAGVLNVVSSMSKSKSGSSSSSDSVEDNVGSVSSRIRDSLSNGKLVIKMATSAPTSSAGAALYNAMGSDDDDEPITKATTKRTTHAKRVPSDDDDTAYRRKRDTSDKDSQQNVGMKRTIRVVAPGDLSFMEGNRNNTVVYSNAQRIGDDNAVCISPPSFVAGIVVLLALLVLTTLTAVILCMRLRSLDRVSNKLKDMDMEYIKHTM